RRLDEGADLEQPPTVSASERPAEQLDAARVGMDEPREDAHRRRLAGTVGAQEAVHDARRDREIQAVERDHLAVALDEPAGRERQAILGGGRHAPASGCGALRITRVSSLDARAGPASGALLRAQP